MEDKRKLMAAVMGAIAAYIQSELQPSSVAPKVKPQSEVNRRQHDPTIKNAK